MSRFELSESTSLAIALWAIVVLGSLAPASVPLAGPAASVADRPATPESSYDAPRLDPSQAKAKLAAGEDMVLVDVRAAESYDHEHITGAISMPWRDMEKGHTQLPKERLLLLYCT